MVHSGTDIYRTFCEKSVIQNIKWKNNFRFSIPCNRGVTSVLAMLKQ
jgi:hypothetical protein